MDFVVSANNIGTARQTKRARPAISADHDACVPGAVAQGWSIAFMRDFVLDSMHVGHLPV